ncbi:DUF3348 family protein [Halioxenophilus aromaticivorans]|uniref:DUF3348 domain-containing protein n=1 Tax=Halioxenophilus aromaticivorans TaxID=1306992 RepID=A0AAV3TYN5_9ALTE
MADVKQFTSGPLHVSRLIQLLQQLHLSNRPVTAYNVAEKLGRLIDLSLSVSLSTTLGGLKRVRGGDNSVPRDQLREKLLHLRELWVADLVTSCDPVKSADAMPLPKLKSDYETDILNAVQPFARFYALQQSEMEHHISGFQRQVRDVLMQSSAEMAQLATLDRSLFEIMAKQTRRAFGTVPLMIAKHLVWHFDHRSAQATANPADHPAWFLLFLNDLKQILLAELDIRLQPVIGLIEARESNIGFAP